jgi:hypothetical protein
VIELFRDALVRHVVRQHLSLPVIGHHDEQLIAQQVERL